jgi:hypothetical protein
MQQKMNIALMSDSRRALSKRFRVPPNGMAVIQAASQL